MSGDEWYPSYGGADVNDQRDAMRKHVEALRAMPEWLRPELRALLHEGRLT